MSTFPAAYAHDGDWETLLDSCLQQLETSYDKATLGFVYTTDTLSADMERIVDGLRLATGIPHWAGTVGIGICAGDREYYDDPAMAVMLCDIPEEHFRTFSIGNDFQEFLRHHGDWIRARPRCTAVTHGDPRNSIIARHIERLKTELPNLYLVGGLISSHSDYPQVADDLYEGGLSGVLLSDSVNIATSLSQGCTPIGGKHTITDCNRNIVNRIDDRPALEVFKEDIGEILSRDLNRVAGYIFIGLPIPESDTGDYTVRNLMAVDVQQQRIVVGDYLNKGQGLMFCRRDGSSAREDLLATLDRLRQRKPGPIRGALYYSCLGRGRQLFGEHSDELKLVHEVLGDFPMVGFFANGEIANNQLYGYTGVITLFF
jgi:small ligand-binding sensory domain FIST